MASVQAAADSRRGALLTSLAEVARDYIELRGVQTQLRIAHDNLRTAQQSLQLTQQRAAGGVTTDLDVANASAQVDTTAAQIPRLEQQEAADINAMSLLLGQPPNALRAELTDAEAGAAGAATGAGGRAVGTRPPPARYPRRPRRSCTRRPPISASRWRILSVRHAYRQHRAAGAGAGQFVQLQRAALPVGPGITMPIFQGGQLRATLHLREAQQEEAAINYQKTVLQAWHEVDNALTAYQTEQARRDQLIQAVAQNHRALSLAQSRYQQGVADFLQVLDARAQPAVHAAAARATARRLSRPTWWRCTRRWAAAGKPTCRGRPMTRRRLTRRRLTRRRPRQRCPRRAAGNPADPIACSAQSLLHQLMAYHILVSQLTGAP